MSERKKPSAVIEELAAHVVSVSGVSIESAAAGITAIALYLDAQEERLRHALKAVRDHSRTARALCTSDHEDTRIDAKIELCEELAKALGLELGP
jgi:predicted protein tyrosine phosphatase